MKSARGITRVSALSCEAFVLGCRRVGRPADEGGEPPAAVDVASLRMTPELAGSHILDHALTQRADGLGTHC
jgi:hypothetical protein